MKNGAFLTIAATVCGMLVILATAAAAMAGRDDEACAASVALRPYIDQTVRYHRRTVADADNAYPLIAKAARHEAQRADPRACRLANGSPPYSDAPDVVDGAEMECIERALDANAPALELLDHALSQPDLVFPLQQYPPNLPKFAPFHRLAALKLERAKQRIREGDREGGAYDLLGLLRYARLFQAGDGDLIHFLVGLAIDAYAMAGARWYAAQPDAEETLLRALLDAVMLNERGLSAAAGQAYRVEFNCVTVGMLEQLFKSGVGLPGWAIGRDPKSARAVRIVFADHANPLDPAATLRLASARTAAIVNATQSDAVRGASDLDAQLSADLVAWPDHWNISARAARVLHAEFAAVANPVGKWWARQLVPHAHWVYLDTVSLCRARARATSALLALRLYELRAGEFPATLADLVSAGILATVPTDPYSGGPLGYSKLAHLVWSAGPEDGPNGGSGCGSDGRNCLWSLPDAFGDRIILTRPPCAPGNAVAHATDASDN